MFFALLLACGMDVGIIQIEDKPQDTASWIVTGKRLEYFAFVKSKYLYID